jgi:hypothetical protein
MSEETFEEFVERMRRIELGARDVHTTGDDWELYYAWKEYDADTSINAFVEKNMKWNELKNAG